MTEFTIVDIKDNEDGSATVQIDMDYDTLIQFAKIGIMKVIEEGAKQVIEDADSEQR